MFIKDLYIPGKPVLSLEIFPPKQDSDFDSIYNVLDKMAALSPDFISVTCGAGGSGGAGEHTKKVASALKNSYNVEPLAHLTCISSDKESIIASAAALKAEGVENILALRGDIPAGSENSPRYYSYATQLIEELADIGGFCIGAACYPEGHIDCDDMEENILHMREKQEAGASFFTTQFFFENSMFYSFLEKARAKNITAPISAGIMPMRTQKLIERMIFTCGTSLPSAIIKLLHKYENSPDDLRKAGTEYAIKQMEDLKQSGVDGIHFYTMNRPYTAKTALARLR